MTVHPIHQQTIEALMARSVEVLTQSTDRIIEWCILVRAADGTPGRFRWAVETTREANVAATAYLLGALQKMGMLDQVLTDEDRREGAAWISGMHRGNEQYYDPALLDRLTPGWPAEKPWPDTAMVCGVN